MAFSVIVHLHRWIVYITRSSSRPAPAAAWPRWSKSPRPGVSCRGCTARRTPRSPSQPSPSPRPRTPGSWRGRAASPPEPPDQSVLGAGLDQGLEPGRHLGLGQREEGELGLVLAVLYCTVLYCTVLYCTVLYCTALAAQLCASCAHCC